MEEASTVVLKGEIFRLTRRIQVASFSYHVAQSVRLMNVINPYTSVSVKEAVIHAPADAKIGASADLENRKVTMLPVTSRYQCRFAVLRHQRLNSTCQRHGHKRRRDDDILVSGPNNVETIHLC